MTYDIRTKEGLLIAEVANLVAQGIMENCPGHFRQWRTKDVTKTCYEIDKDMQSIHPMITIRLWKGYVLIPK